MLVETDRPKPGTKEHLEKELRKTQKKSFAEGTIKNLLSQWRAFYAFCNIYSIYVWPVTAHVLCLFAQFLSYNLKSPDSIVNYLAGVRTLHLLTNAKPPLLSDFEVQITVRGLRKRLKHAVKQAPPMTPLLMAQIHALLNFKKKADIVFWAIITMGFFMMLRASNLVPKTAKKFSARKQLTRKMIDFTDFGLDARITWSKTIQFNERELAIPVYAIKNSILCPIKAVKKVLKVSKSSKNGPLFGLNDKNPFTYSMLQRKLKTVSKLLGLKAKHTLTSHSMRRGSVEWAQRNNIQDSLIQIFGDWKSDSFKRYLQFPLETQLQVGKQMIQKFANLKKM